MPPVIVVDHVVDEYLTDIDGKGGLQEGLPGALLDEEAERGGNGPDGERDVGEAAELAIGGEALQPHIVLVLAEELAEGEGADAERVLLDEEEAEGMAAEAA